MYAPPPAIVPAPAGRSGGLATGPILAICCLLFILFLIATTIILALIPVYLPRKDVTTSAASNSPYYIVGNLGQSPGGDTALDAANRARVAQSLDAATGAPAGTTTVQNGALQAVTSGRKRRTLALTRTRRQGVVYTIFLVVVFNVRLCAFCGLAGFSSRFAVFTLVVELFLFGAFRSLRCAMRLTRIFFDIVAILGTIAANAATTTTAASVTQSVG
jgi:hypothetical protein